MMRPTEPGRGGGAVGVRFEDQPVIQALLVGYAQGAHEDREGSDAEGGLADAAGAGGLDLSIAAFYLHGQGYRGRAAADGEGAVDGSRARCQGARKADAGMVGGREHIITQHVLAGRCDVVGGRGALKSSPARRRSASLSTSRPSTGIVTAIHVTPASFTRAQPVTVPAATVWLWPASAMGPAR